jgi:hypothetical protein
LKGFLHLPQGRSGEFLRQSRPEFWLSVLAALSNAVTSAAGFTIDHYRQTPVSA